VGSIILREHKKSAVKVENRKHMSLLNPAFMKTLHKKMFCHVWRWAGEFRKTHTTIGVEVYHISSELMTLFEDTEYWIHNKTYSEDEIAARFLMCINLP